MSLKDSLQERFRRFSEEALPGALGDVGEKIEHFRKRLDHLNCSLAERALPEDRKPRVRELSLSRKAERAGQKVVKLREKI
ncbi:hypothetical protein [Marinobacter sp. SS13-12]|uniref:hypothetical protein n=1 Tax=Marinobacter sp. SS13-12 TaxID=3050451 RepID=UPI0025521D28|nr:hypothetical protein [Marinobacter sp. SS13-12]MDK8463900.1 hypothetical protein [Marinobacter sp. SS13-12]